MDIYIDVDITIDIYSDVYVCVCYMFAGTLRFIVEAFGYVDSGAVLYIHMDRYI